MLRIKNSLLTLFIAFFAFQFTSEAQTVNLLPSSFNAEPCDTMSLDIGVVPHGSDTLALGKFSLPITAEWNYLSSSASFKGSTSLDSVLHGDSVHFFFSNLNATDTLQFEIVTTCEAIKATNYNFNIELFSSLLMSNLNLYSFTNTSFVTLNSPYLIAESRQYSDPILNDTLFRRTVIRNTGSKSFTGDLSFAFNSDYYADIVGFGVIYNSSFSIYSNVWSDSIGIIKGGLANFLPNDSLVFLDTTLLRACIIDSAKTHYQMNYGCDSTNLCQEVDIDPFVYVNILDPRPVLDVFMYEGDSICFLDSNYNTYRFGITNTGSNASKDFVISFNKVFGANLHEATKKGDLTLYLNGVPKTTFDSVLYVGRCNNDSVYYTMLDTIDLFNPGDTLIVEYKMTNCFDDNIVFSGYKNYRINFSSAESCYGGRHTYTDGFQFSKTYYLSQFFENYHPAIQITAGHDTSAHYDFTINNIDATFGHNKSKIGDSPGFSEELFRDSTGVIEVELILSEGLIYKDNTLKMTPNSGSYIQSDWLPYNIFKSTVPKVGSATQTLYPHGGGDTIIARFSIPDTFYGFRNINHYWIYDTLSSYLSNSTVKFTLQGICSAPPNSEIVQNIYLIPDTNCTNTRRIKISESTEEIAIMCPGCLIPGYITNALSFDRISVGELDTNDNHFPDHPNQNVRADLSQINTKRCLLGDTLSFHLSSHLWDGTEVNVTDLNFDLKNTVVKINDMQGNGLEFISDLEVIFHEASPQTKDTIYIPTSYLKTDGPWTYLDLHIDTLKSRGWANSSLDYYDGGDIIEINGLVKVVTNAGDDYEILTTWSRVYAAEVIDDSLRGIGVDAVDRYATYPTKDSLRGIDMYWCEFFGNKITKVKMGYTDTNKLFSQGWGSLYSNIVSPRTVLTFLHQYYTSGGAIIGKDNDDSFPFEYRNFVELDTLTISKPNHYRLEKIKAWKLGSLHNGSLNMFTSQTDYMDSIPLLTNNTYEIYPREIFVHVDSLPPLDLDGKLTRADTVYNSDEENIPKVQMSLIPTNCAAVIGDSVLFSFEGKVNKYPNQDSAFTIVKDGIYAFLPEVVMETQAISPDTVYVNDTLNKSSFRLRNAHELNPILPGSNPSNNRYVMDLMPNLFARVIPSQNISNVEIFVYGQTHPAYRHEYIDSLDLYALGFMGRSGNNDHREYDLYFEFNCENGLQQNGLDSIIVITGWNCDGLPTDITTACQLDTLVYMVEPQYAGLDAQFVSEDSNLYCNPQSYEVILNSQGTGKMVDIEAALDISNSSKTYKIGSGILDFDGSIIPFEPDSDLVWHFNDINHFLQNGFKYSDGEAKILFELEGWPEDKDEFISVDVFGKTYCGDTITFNFSKDFKKIGIQGDLSATDSITMCDTMGYTLCLNSLDSGQVWNISANLDLSGTGYTYVANSARIEFPANTYLIEEPNGTSWYFDSIPYLLQNGLVNADSALKLHFDIVGTSASNNDTLKMDVIGVTDCNDSIQLNFSKTLPNAYGNDTAFKFVSAGMALDWCTFYYPELYNDSLELSYILDSTALGADSIVIVFDIPITQPDTTIGLFKHLGGTKYSYTVPKPYVINQSIDLKFALHGDDNLQYSVCSEVISINGLVYDNNYCLTAGNNIVHDVTNVVHGSDTGRLDVVYSSYCELSGDSSKVCAYFVNNDSLARRFDVSIVSYSVNGGGGNTLVSYYDTLIQPNGQDTIKLCKTIAGRHKIMKARQEAVQDICNCADPIFEHIPLSGVCSGFVLDSDPWRTSFNDLDRNHNHYSIEKSGVNTVIAGTLFDSTDLKITETQIIKITPRGQTLWKKTYDFGDIDERCFDVFVTEDEEILLTGYVQSSEDMDPSKIRVFMAHLDSDGELINLKKFIPNHDHDMVGLDILKSPNSPYYHVAGYAAESALENQGSRRAFILALDDNFDLAWYREITQGEGTHDIANDITDIPGLGVFVTGSIGQEGQNSSALARIFDYDGNQMWDLTRNTVGEDDIIGVDAVYSENEDALFLLVNNKSNKTFEINMIDDIHSSPFHAMSYSNDYFNSLKSIAGYAIELSPKPNTLLIGGFMKYMERDGVFTDNTPSFIVETDYSQQTFNWLKYLENGNYKYRDHDLDVFQAFNGDRALFNYPDILCLPNDENIQIVDYESNGFTYEVGVTQLDENGDDLDDELACQIEYMANTEGKEPELIYTEVIDDDGYTEQFNFQSISTPLLTDGACPSVDHCNDSWGVYLSYRYPDTWISNWPSNDTNLFAVEALGFLGTSNVSNVTIEVDWGDGNVDIINNPTVFSTYNQWAQQYGPPGEFIFHTFGSNIGCRDICVKWIFNGANGKPCEVEFCMTYDQAGVPCNPNLRKRFIQDQSEDTYNGINVFPNPTNEQLYIEFTEQLDQGAELMLMSIEGKVVWQESVGQVSKHSLDVSNLPKGIYYLQVNTPQKQLREKIIVQ